MKNQYLLRQRFLIRFPWNSPAVLRIVLALSQEFLEGALIWHPNKHALCIYLYTKYTYTLSHTYTLSYTHTHTPIYTNSVLLMVQSGTERGPAKMESLMESLHHQLDLFGSGLWLFYANL